MIHELVSGRIRHGLKTTLRIPALILALSAATGALAGCNSMYPARPDSRTIDAETFIEAYIALRHAAIEVGDTTPEFEERKRDILERYEITGQDLLDFVDGNIDDLSKLHSIWDSIARRIGKRDPDPGS